MILDLKLSDIKPNHLTHRFFLLQQIVALYPHQPQPEQNQPDNTNPERYKKILEDLEHLEEIATNMNSEYKNQELQSNLVLTDLAQEYSQENQKLESSHREFEGLLMKTWRDTINAKKLKEEQHLQIKKAKGGNNKNLMFLTSQILKKGRTAKSRLQLQMKHLQAQVDNLSALLYLEQAQKQKDFDLFNQLLKNWQQQNSLFLQKHQQKLQGSKNNLTTQINSARQQTQRLLKSQQKQSNQTEQQIYQLLETVISKQQSLS